MPLSDIETKNGFTYPIIYKEFFLDGMLNVGEYGPDWYSTVYPKLKENPTLLLHSYDFELLNLKGVNEAIDELLDPEGYREIKEEFKFIPFGQSGAGDHYCFFVSEENNGENPIVFVWHDMNEVNYLAKNMQDFVFRMLLTDMSDQDVYNDVSDEEFKDNLERVLKTHKKYLTDKQNDVLQTVFNRGIIDYEILLPKMKEAKRGLLTDVELKKTLAEVIPFDKMDSSFEYSRES
ncbi:hypothetical protein OA93_02885 [Flavobacterium sp. KMS]|uniref:SMI1/KNR4 family protein n=1 Tax=Flavobacterium sp. KMS TaxID=1566023 RepID=UPI00057F0464|nr:SMI1/KNR4 family protein [Flavobacterium sp. KMS]KIA99784.1 hypothetical protein OA93_02885 [Flavobacterium sp. KMS]